MDLNYTCSNVASSCTRRKCSYENNYMIFWNIDMLINFLRSRNKSVSKNICPNCGSQLIHESGCAHCPNCGWSACDN